MEETSDRIGTNWGSRIDWFLWEWKIGFYGNVRLVLMGM